ncbi:MAG: type I DNA topoisomerase [Planctomycetes bacterium]|nr:type I DNA topoisomerase [Planctomycetota bacterium]
MAAKKQGAKPVVIVESPAKARTIARFLGSGYAIEASVGHIRDLPANAAEVPAKHKKEKWARLGIDVERDFAPLYVVPKEKKDHIKKLKQLVQDASVVYLATDEDREGESISWHLVDELKPKGEIKRLVFHEITKSAIEHALANPRDIDQNLVEAQETRRLVDRLYGYEVSPVLWRKIKPRLSAGRVQSVAVKLVVERERERIRFVPTDYWDLIGTFRAGEQDPFDATLVAIGEQRLASGKDFDPDTGRLTDAARDRRHLDEAGARALVERLTGVDAVVESLEQKPFTERPQAPFTTSTLQQAAGGRLGFPARRTMRAAQRLYENGYITYMRTDSVTLSTEAIQAARRLIAEKYGDAFVPEKPRYYQQKVKNAQEAHEAIRPAGATFTPPDALGADMGSDERRIYELIWKRTVACQMKDATGKRTTLQLKVDDARFQTSGRTIEFPGFRLAYASDRDDENGDRILPKVAEGDGVAVVELVPDGHTTKSPARLTEATLVRELERLGIGRPSTYASIIETIQSREYCFKKGQALVPTFTAFAVVKLLDHHLKWLVDYAFTARMEDDLDEISNGRKQRLEYLRSFWMGDGHPGLRDQLSEVDAKIDPREVCTVEGFHLEPFDGNAIGVRVGRYGPFLACGELSASLPDEFAPDELTTALAHDLLAKAKAGPTALGSDPQTGQKIYVKVGRYGPYFQRGSAEELGDEKPKMASLLRGMTPENVTLEQALQVLALPRELGELTLPDTESAAGERHPVVAHNGRFGPYLKCGPATRSLGPDDDLLTVTLERAAELFAQPKQRGGRGGPAAQPKALRELGEHPETRAAVRILDGRYGPYVSDGTTNASLPKDEDVESCTLQRAIDLLKERAAQGGTKKKAGRKKAPGKSSGGKGGSAQSGGATRTTKKAKSGTRKKSASPRSGGSRKKASGGA